MKPLDSAQTIFDEAFAALMAHTICGVKNEFLAQDIELFMVIRPDLHGFIKLKDPKKGATSVLTSRFLTKARQLERDRLYATIYIHADANKPLARICIAHEMYHLLLELYEYVENGKVAWPKNLNHKQNMEDACNQFAWQLCFQHDKFNRHDGLRKEHMIFPDGTFDRPFKMHDSTDWIKNWPNGIALDPTRPFYKSKCPPLDAK